MNRAAVKPTRPGASHANVGAKRARRLCRRAQHACKRVARTWPKRCQLAHAQPRRTRRRERDAQRRAPARPWVGVRSTRAHADRWLTGSCSSGGARHERLLREAPRWRGACRPVLHGSWPLRKRRDSAAVCVTQRYVKSPKAIYPRTGNAQRAAQRGADRLDFLSDRGPVRRSGAVRVRSPGCSA